MRYLEEERMKVLTQSDYCEICCQELEHDLDGCKIPHTECERDQ